MSVGRESKSDYGFLRWAGGKRWLAKGLVEFMNLVTYKNYIEPFVGGGSMFFSLQPKSSILGDCNRELINAFRQVKNNPSLVARGLAPLKVCPLAFSDMKSSRPSSPLERAIRFIYLNRTCFNGLYRTNKQGDFNVPYGDGKRSHHTLLENGTLASCSKLLKSSKLTCQDFSETMALASEGDVIYCDPAYTVAHGNNGFVRYNENVFSWDDQIRLRISAEEAASKGVMVIISNASHMSLEQLYKPFKPLVLERNSMMSATTGRGKYQEYLFLLGGEASQRRSLMKVLASHGTLKAS